MSNTVVGTILVAEADAALASSLCDKITSLGMELLRCGAGAEALRLLDEHPAQVLVCSTSLPDMTTSFLIGAVRERWPGLPIVLLTHAERESLAISSLRLGATDFLEAPFDTDALRFVLSKALTQVERTLELPPPPSSGPPSMLGSSAAMQLVRATLERAAKSTATVLVRGESGTGKEIAARAIHEASPRANEAFVKIDCASLPEQLLESELFGYEKGAFTGATTRKPGRAELADKGTLFLDEIGELTMPLQAKLLRLLQDRQLDRLGGTKTIHVDVRVVVATHRDLEGMIESKQFRLDLFYRLNVIPLWLPPLRSRREDIEVLARHFTSEVAKANDKPGLALSPAALKALRGMRWPGNVRQLQNFIERLVVLSTSDSIEEDDVRAELSKNVKFTTQSGAGSQFRPLAAPPQSLPPGTHETASVVMPLDLEMRAAEKRALERALRVAKQNRSVAARLLGVSRSTLYAKLKEHGFL